MTSITPLILTGNNAFHKQSDYDTVTKNEMQQRGALKTVNYRFETESKVMRVAKIIFAIIFFPVGIFWGLHALIGKIIVQSSWRTTLPVKNEDVKINDFRKMAVDSYSQHKNGKDWKIKRITVEVNGTSIDGYIVGQEKTLGNGRWVLHSNGNGEMYEMGLAFEGSSKGYHSMLKKLNANGLFFNYSGVGDSGGAPTRPELVAAYQGMLRYLEDDKKGLGAKEIIAHGHSLGGGVQGEALKNYSLSNKIKYLFVKDRTFYDLCAAIAGMFNAAVAFLAKIFCWNISSVETSKGMKSPEVIIQTASSKDYEEIKKASDVIGDGVISGEGSHAKKLLSDPQCPKANKKFIGVSKIPGDDAHCESLKWSKLAPIFEKQLKLQPAQAA